MAQNSPILRLAASHFRIDYLTLNAPRSTPSKTRNQLLAQIEAYQPRIAEKAQAWVAEIDKPLPRQPQTAKRSV